MSLNNTQMMFKLMLMMSTLMVLFNTMWMEMWMYLEINLITFIYLMINYKNYSCLESSLIYFLIQTIASILLLLSFIYLNFFKNFNIIIMMSLLLKMAMSPLHYWIIIIIEMMNWNMILLLLTWQKIAPLFLFNLYNNFKYTIYFMIMSMLIGSMMGLNYSSLKKIMSYSSINQLSWLIISMYLMNKFMKIYLIMYMYMMLITIYSFKKLKIKYIYNMMNMKNNYYLMFLLCNLLSLGGLPPFIGFYPKLMIIINMNNNSMMIMMIMMSMFSLFYYLRIMISSMMINNLLINKINFKKLMSNNLNLLISISNTILLMLLIIY